MNKTIVGTGIFLGMMAIILGAFGAHGLKEVIAPADLAVFETGVDYQMYHALLLLLVGGMVPLKEAHKKWVYYLITAGVVCFSFSLYVIATREVTGMSLQFIGILTPIGGLLFLLGWGLLGYRVFKPMD